MYIYRYIAIIGMHSCVLHCVVMYTLDENFLKGNRLVAAHFCSQHPLLIAMFAWFLSYQGDPVEYMLHKSAAA